MIRRKMAESGFMEKSGMLDIMGALGRSIYYAAFFRKNRAYLHQLSELLEDRESREVLDGILRAYKTVFRTPEYYFSKIACDKCTEYHFTSKGGQRVLGTKNPYFLEDIFEMSQDMVFLDGGAYVGDTISLLFDILGGPCRHVYAFEPNRVNFRKLERTAEKFGSCIECLQAGLYDRGGEVPFIERDSASRIIKSGKTTIPVVDTGKYLGGLEEDLPTFIKLDIEGVEKKVILSMKDFLREQHPDLAVSVYHKLEHLWEIPLLIHRIHPGYRIFLRHQSNFFTETICYAVSR